jgi:hypothetical protein
VQEVVQVTAVVAGRLSVAIAAKELAHDAAAPRGSAIVVHTKGGGLVLCHFVRTVSSLGKVANYREAKLFMGWAGA